MGKLYEEAFKSASNAVGEDGRWLMGVPAIVTDNQDPERQHRVRVVIPSINEDVIFDEWARQMVFCLGDGFGSAFIPPVGAEVVLFGQLGQKFNLFYAALYNEEMTMPAGFDDEMTVGVHAPGELQLIAEAVVKILAENVEATAAQKIALDAQTIEAVASAAAKLKGSNATVEATTQTQIKGATVKIDASGAITITGGNVQITGSSIKLFNRTVNPTGPPI